jgi:GGDEF domain-containing protein
MLLALGTVFESPPVVHLDDVTGLPASLELNKMIRRLPRRYALACVAIDEFTTYRDEHGPDVAKKLLRLVAAALTKIGGGGRVFYLMREREFVVVFRRASVQAATRHLDAVRRAVEAATLDVSVQKQPGGKTPGKAPVAVERTVAATISAGIAEPHSRGADPFKVLHAAEHALENARRSGMNRIAVEPRADASTAAQTG